MKWCKAVVALLLLPVCVGLTLALARITAESGRAVTVWVGLLAGVACWLAIFLQLPKPVWLYVLGHELTHVLWAWLFGGRLLRFKASSQGGHVMVSKSNWVTALAPYFFPLYALLVVLAFQIGNRFWDLSRFQVWFHLLLGATYAFHTTLTVYILKTRQSDITSQGYLFSAVVIWLGNLSVLLVGIPLLTGMELRTAGAECWRSTWEIWQFLAGWLPRR